jgi:hypothetical protein
MRLFTLAEIQNFWATKWKEAREESYALNLGNTTASATLVGYIDASDYALAVASILGYSTVRYTSDFVELYRVAPVCHPRIMNLYASAVRITPYAFAEAGRPLNPWENKEFAPTYVFTYANAPQMLEGFNVARYTSNYKKLRVEIDFSEFVGVTFASNDQPNFQREFFNKEWKRYTKITLDYNLEVLQMDNAANLVFDAGPPKNQAFPTPVGVMLPQGRLNVKWMWVPHEFVQEWEDDISTKAVINSSILLRLGKVNKDRFLGFTEGRLLFVSWKTEPVVVPVADADSNSVIMKLAWNLDFDFLYLLTSAEETYPGLPLTEHWRFFGHNVFPWRGNGKFYPASIRRSDDNIPGRALYDATFFEPIFRTSRARH